MKIGDAEVCLDAHGILTQGRSSHRTYLSSHRDITLGSSRDEGLREERS